MIMAETIFLSFTMTGTPVAGAKKPAGKTVSGYLHRTFVQADDLIRRLAGGVR